MAKKKYTINDKINLIVRVLFVIAFIETILTSVLENDYSSTINAFTAVLGFTLTFIPEAVENITKNRVRFGSGMKIAIVLFIFGSELLGEIRSFYEIIPWWDDLLHSVSGVILGLIGFMLVYSLNESKKSSVNLSPVFVSLFAFCFALACGALWEIFEFSVDRLFMKDMQKDTIIHTITSVSLDPTNSNIPITISGINDVVVNGESLGLGGYLDIGLIDTMGDLIVNLIGALVFSVIGFFHQKSKHRSKVAEMFVPTVQEEENSDERERKSEN